MLQTLQVLQGVEAKAMGDGTVEVLVGELAGQRVPVLTIEELGAMVGEPGLQWADERRWCRHVAEGKRPAGCAMFGCDEHTPGGFCRLNGYSVAAWGLERALAMRTPCIFDGGR